MTTGEDVDRLGELEAAATPGPFTVVWPDEQGGSFVVWGKQGTREAHFTDGWAIPVLARGVQSNMEYLAALANAAPSLIADAREVERLRAAMRLFVTNSERYGHHDVACPAAFVEVGEEADSACTCGFARRMYETWVLADDCGVSGYSMQAAISRDRLARLAP